MVVEATHLRADAQRNLGLILEAARAVFAEKGLGASIADVAERAGVGTATIFRRFPTKDDLVTAILEEELSAVTARANAALENPDPFVGLGEFVEWAVESSIQGRCFCEASGGELFVRPRIQELLAELAAGVERMLQRGKDAGVVRSDVTADEIGFLINAIAQAGLRIERTPGALRRYVDIMLDGLRPRPKGVAGRRGTRQQSP
jgi:AcrR family transcriptional regulator